MTLKLHVRPTLRFAFAVEGRKASLTRVAAYRGARLAAIAKRCECYNGTGAPDDPREVCDYHSALEDGGAGEADPDYEEAQRRLKVLDRLVAIYKAEDKKAIADLERPALDLSHMRQDELEMILVAIDWHLTNGEHKPARKRRSK